MCLFEISYYSLSFSAYSRRMIHEYELYYRDSTGKIIPDAYKFNVIVTTYEVMLCESTCTMPDLSIYLSIYLSINLSIYLSTCIYLSIYLHVHVSIYLSIYLSTYLSIYLSIYPSTSFIYKHIHLSIYLSIYPSIYLFIILISSSS